MIVKIIHVEHADGEVDTITITIGDQPQEVTLGKRQSSKIWMVE